MKFLLLDFDGTLIEDNGGRAYDPSSMRLLPGVSDGLKRLQGVGMQVFIVSNQSKVARKVDTAANVAAAFDGVIQLLKAEGVRIEAAEQCPHRMEDACTCRKPKTGMWEALRSRFPNLTAEETILVGDMDRDIQMGRAIGCRTARIFSSKFPRAVPADFLVRSLSELADLLLAPTERMQSLAGVVRIAQGARAKGQTVVTTNGAFDLFHSGHRFLLEEARKYGDVLIVGVNSDASVRKAKGEGRPLQSAETRARSVSRFADAVFIFDDDDPRPWLPQIKPQVHVNAATYGAQCVERPILDQIGAKLVLVPVKKELGSTTQHLSDVHPSA
ncbi:MAG: HAD-IIIA family hydrolase [Candidatus Peribacteraceae bacterium]|nr:HAD-IIIA family hydrolase [Candidatus Peribacteraceae bacterium]MDD5741926.1 HAD-IIIA family hydrolase [Candidatus Peribacteraceae bacterium]